MDEVPHTNDDAKWKRRLLAYTGVRAIGLAIFFLGVATGKSDRGLKHCLDLHGIHARFVSLQTADRHPSKPHPSMALLAIEEAGASPETTFVVGDTSFDMAMAAAAGALPVGAGWGYHDAEDLLRAGAAGVADAPGDVLALIAEHVHG